MPSLRTAIGRALTPRTRRALLDLELRLTRALHGSPVARLARTAALRRHLRRPEEIDIEITSSCDADCIMCPRRAMRRSPGPMPLPLFERIVAEAVELGVRDLVLNGYGEIGTLRNAPDYLAAIRRRSAGIRVLVNTNGMRLTPELAKAFIAYRVDVVNIAIDGATAATYERIRKYLKLDVVEENVRGLLRARNASGRKSPLVMVHMIRMPENAHEADAFLRKWRGVADYAGLAGVTSRAGSVAAPQRPDDWASTPCFLLWRQMPILSDGTVAMCCDDWDGAMSPGNVTGTGIRAIWSSSQHERIRRIHREGRAAQVPLCRGCQSPRRPPWWFGGA